MPKVGDTSSDWFYIESKYTRNNRWKRILASKQHFDQIAWFLTEMLLMTFLKVVLNIIKQCVQIIGLFNEKSIYRFLMCPRVNILNRD